MPGPTRTNTTLLLVCEGYAEVELARVVRELYLPRYCGTSLRAENRRGFGGAAALQLAIQRKREGDYDRFGVLVDTDCHWSDAERRLADRHAIVAIECTPCIEAMLLTVDGKRAHARTLDNKAEFERVYGGPPNRPGVIGRNFTRAKFDGARPRVHAIDKLLSFVGG
jgi:hypothetical protein